MESTSKTFVRYLRTDGTDDPAYHSPGRSSIDTQASTQLSDSQVNLPGNISPARPVPPPVRDNSPPRSEDLEGGEDAIDTHAPLTGPFNPLPFRMSFERVEPVPGLAPPFIPTPEGLPGIAGPTRKFSVDDAASASGASSWMGRARSALRGKGKGKPAASEGDERSDSETSQVNTIPSTRNRKADDPVLAGEAPTKPSSGMPEMIDRLMAKIERLEKAIRRRDETIDKMASRMEEISVASKTYVDQAVASSETRLRSHLTLSTPVINMAGTAIPARAPITALTTRARKVIS